MKKIIAVLLAVVLTASFIWGCGSPKNNEKEIPKGPSIITTIFPEYDWVRNILGDNPGDFNLSMLLESGVDIHSYQATAQDILNISNCDIFIYVGGESDSWVKDALKESTNKDLIVLNLMDLLGDRLKIEEVVEGMEVDQEEEHDHDQDENDCDDDDEHNDDDDHNGYDDHNHDQEFDEHVWLSLRNAKILCTAIEEAIEKVDEKNASTYRDNLNKYIARLEKLDGEYEEVLSSGTKDTIVVADRFPFRYMVDDYGLKYFAAFVGCSAETEASFETITFLAKKTDELAIDNILVIEGKEHKIADTIVQNTRGKNQSILILNSMQGVTFEEIENGATYLGIMRDNLQVLGDALK